MSKLSSESGQGKFRGDQEINLAIKRNEKIVKKNLKKASLILEKKKRGYKPRVEKILKETNQIIDLIRGRDDAQYFPHFRLVKKNKQFYIQKYEPSFEKSLRSKNDLKPLVLPKLTNITEKYKQFFFGDSDYTPEDDEGTFRGIDVNPGINMDSPDVAFSGFPIENLYDSGDLNVEVAKYVPQGWMHLELFLLEFDQFGELLLPNIPNNYLLLEEMIRVYISYGFDICLTFSEVDYDKGKILPPHNCDPTLN